MKTDNTLPKTHRVLVVDDDQTMILHLSKALKKAGLEVQTASDGASALAAFQTARPDLTLLDLNMPDMGGMEALAAIRQKSSALEIPVIVCTSNGADEAVEAALAAGANDYLVKPVSARSAVARVNLHLKLSQLSRELSERQQQDAVAAMVVTYNHELNNPLAAAVAFLDILGTKNELSEEVRGIVDNIRRSTDRVVNIVKQIRQVSKSRLVKVNYSENTQMIALDPKERRED